MISELALDVSRLCTDEEVAELGNEPGGDDMSVEVGLEGLRLEELRSEVDRAGPLVLGIAILISGFRTGLLDVLAPGCACWTMSFDSVAENLLKTFSGIQYVCPSFSTATTLGSEVLEPPCRGRSSSLERGVVISKDSDSGTASKVLHSILVTEPFWMFPRFNLPMILL